MGLPTTRISKTLSVFKNPSLEFILITHAEIVVFYQDNFLAGRPWLLKIIIIAEAAHGVLRYFLEL